MKKMKIIKKSLLEVQKTKKMKFLKTTEETRSSLTGGGHEL